MIRSGKVDMRAAKKIADNKRILQELVPLNALSDERFNEISEKIVIEVVKSGRYVFRQGDRDNRTVYLLEGKVNLLDESRKVTDLSLIHISEPTRLQ